MSRVILCSGQKAKTPYVFKETGVRIYSIEELCYYLRNIIDSLTSNMLDYELADFISEELQLPERGKLLEQLIIRNANLKDRLVAILCSCDYFVESEINEICEEIDRIDSMTLAERNKRRADKYMSSGYNREALHEYKKIISGKGGVGLDSVSYGNILHNIGVIQINAGQYNEAASNFLEAYERNENKESLKSYLFALQMGRRFDEYEKALIQLVDSVNIPNEMQKEAERINDNLDMSGELDEFMRLKTLWQQERFTEYDRLVAQMINSFKRKYREDNK